jgi:hypothetical protein
VTQQGADLVEGGAGAKELRREVMTEAVEVETALGEAGDAENVAPEGG